MRTNETPFLLLGQFEPTDNPEWLQDYNGDMLKIDTKMSEVSTKLDGTKADIMSTVSQTFGPALSSLSTLNSDMMQAKMDIDNIETDVSGLGNQNALRIVEINGLNNRVSDVESDVQNLQNLISTNTFNGTVIFEGASNGSTSMATNVVVMTESIFNFKAIGIEYTCTNTSLNGNIDCVRKGSLLSTSGLVVNTTLQGVDGATMFGDSHYVNDAQTYSWLGHFRNNTDLVVDGVVSNGFTNPKIYRVVGYN